jgi:hypothetical protein
MKKILFWITFVPMVVIMIIAGLIQSACEKYDEWLHTYERWCFDDPTIL